MTYIPHRVLLFCFLILLLNCEFFIVGIRYIPEEGVSTSLGEGLDWN